jgi:hypothetical protein
MIPDRVRHFGRSWCGCSGHMNAALCVALAGQREVAQKYAGRLRESRPGYRISDFFEAFPFQSADYVATFHKGLRLLGLPE